MCALLKSLLQKSPGKLSMNSRNEMKVIRDVSCTNSLHNDSELRGVGPNPLDFRNVMEKIRGKTGSFFQSLHHACYSPPVFFGLIVMSERWIGFNIKKMGKCTQCHSWKQHEPHLKKNME